MQLELKSPPVADGQAAEPEGGDGEEGEGVEVGEEEEDAGDPEERGRGQEGEVLGGPLKGAEDGAASS